VVVGVVLVVAVLAVLVLGEVVVAVLPVVVVEVAGLAVVDVFLCVVAVDDPVLAVVAVFGVVVAGGGVCVDSVCASKIPAEIKLQIRTMIECFIIHPFKNTQVDKLPRPRRQYKNREMPPHCTEAG
jgi:hypothetical protein